MTDVTLWSLDRQLNAAEIVSKWRREIGIKQITRADLDDLYLLSEDSFHYFVWLTTKTEKLGGEQ